MGSTGLCTGNLSSCYKNGFLRHNIHWASNYFSLLKLCIALEDLKIIFMMFLLLSYRGVTKFCFCFRVAGLNVDQPDSCDAAGQSLVNLVFENAKRIRLSSKEGFITLGYTEKHGTWTLINRGIRGGES